jgi:hypothetical protein
MIKQAIVLFSIVIVARAPAFDAGEFAMAPGGGFLRDGKPVYLIGNIVYADPHAADYAPFFTNVPGWEWIYERPPSREQFDRLAFNATGGEVSTTWMRKYRPEKSFWQAGYQIDWADVAPGYYKNGLPVFVDFTCAHWSHGGLRYVEGRAPSKDAFSAGECHFMPYSVVTDEGFALYKEMWQSGARELLANGVRPFVYELFNEPTCHDTSPAAEAAFAKLAAKLPPDASTTVKKIARMRFDEKLFARAMKRGKAALREVDPLARTCFQPLGISFGYVNLLLANETTDVVMAPTGGGDAYDALVCLAVAGDRPVLDGEAYMGTTRRSHRARILVEYARGYNATYYFKWGRRARKHATWKEPDGPKKLAEQFPYECLNSAACPPEAFAGMKDAADDIAAVNDLFTPRDRGVAPSVALLVSQATERLGRAEKRPNATYAREAALALLAARLPVKAVFEEQLDAAHLADVKLIVAAGIDATLPKTNARLREWVEKGGILLTVENTLDQTEFGTPAKDAFVTGRDEAFGKGRLVHLAKRPMSQDAPRVYRDIAAKCGVEPTCVITDARTGVELPGVECAAARTPGAAGFILINNDLMPRAVRVRPVSVGAKAAKPWIDVRTRQGVAQTAEGDLLVKLLPGEPVVLRTAAVAGRPPYQSASHTVGTDPRTDPRSVGSGPNRSVGTDPNCSFIKMNMPAGPVPTAAGPVPTAAGPVPSQTGPVPTAAGPVPMRLMGPVPTEEEFFSGLSEWFSANSPNVSTDAYWVDVATVEAVDLSRVANGALEDIFGKIPWGRQVCQGIPFEFIRIDQNDERSGVFLDQGAATAEVRGAARAFDVLFAAPQDAKGELFDVTFAFTDGTTATHVISAPDDTRLVGWQNLAGKGLWLARRTRLDATREVKGVKFSARQKGVAVAAMSVERPEANPFVAAFDPKTLKLSQWGGVKLSTTDDEIVMGVDDRTVNWACCSATFAKPLALTAADVASRSLVFEVNQGETPAGGLATHAAKLPQVLFRYGTADGQVKNGTYVLADRGGSVDADGSTWQELRVPLRRLVPVDATSVTGFGAQFLSFDSHRAGLRLRALRIE